MPNDLSPASLVGVVVSRFPLYSTNDQDHHKQSQLLQKFLQVVPVLQLFQHARKVLVALTRPASKTIHIFFDPMAFLTSL